MPFPRPPRPPIKRGASSRACMHAIAQSKRTHPSLFHLPKRTHQDFLDGASSVADTKLARLVGVTVRACCGQCGRSVGAPHARMHACMHASPISCTPSLHMIMLSLAKPATRGEHAPRHHLWCRPHCTSLSIPIIRAAALLWPWRSGRANERS
jgi:hypothetical protein